MLEGVVQPGQHAGHDASRLQRLELSAHLEKIAQIVSLDKIHRDIIHQAFAHYFVNRDDVRMFQVHPQLAFAAEQLCLLRPVAHPLAEHLDGKQIVGFLVGRPIDASERTGAHQIEHLVIAVEETVAKALVEPIELITGQQVSAEQELSELVTRDAARTQFTPDALQVCFGQHVDVQRALGQLFGS